MIRYNQVSNNITNIRIINIILGPADKVVKSYEKYASQSCAYKIWKLFRSRIKMQIT